jgi:diadenosine tetraphosphate (Ap4A) HIT family hydrolase
VADCFACALSQGRLPLPGGLIFRTDHWLVEHCVGSLGLGTLVVKPERHVATVAALDDEEVREIGPLLRQASSVAQRLVGADQVYNCLWSHAGGVPVHLHYVIQPVTRAQMADYGSLGPALQAEMLSTGPVQDPRDVERIADRARLMFTS